MTGRDGASLPSDRSYLLLNLHSFSPHNSANLMVRKSLRTTERKLWRAAGESTGGNRCCHLSKACALRYLSPYSKPMQGGNVVVFGASCLQKTNPIISQHINCNDWNSIHRMGPGHAMRCDECTPTDRKLYVWIYIES